MKPVFHLIFLGLAACSTQISMPEPREGQALFAENCASCHGTTGRGDGPWASDLSTRPPDLTKLSDGGKFPRVRVLSVIDGYHRANLQGQEMPEFGLLLEGETVPIETDDGVLTPTPRPLAALLVYLESIQEY